MGRFGWVPVCAVCTLLTACGGGGASRTKHFDVKAAFAEVKTAQAAAREARRSADERSAQTAGPGYEAAYTRYQNTLARFLTVAINHAPDAPETREGLDLYAGEAVSNAEEIRRRGGGNGRAREVLEQARRTFLAAGREPPASLERALAGLPSPRPTSTPGGQGSP